MARPKTSTGTPAAPNVAALRKMGIYQCKTDGRWMAKIKIGVNPDTHQPIFARPKAAELSVLLARREAILKKQQDGEAVGGRELKGQTTGEWALHYLEHVVRPKATATTYDNYKWVIEKLICKAPKGVAPIGPIVFRELSTQRIEEYKTALIKAGVGAPSINYMISRLRAMFNAAVARSEMRVPYNRALAVEKEEEIGKTPWVGSPAETRLLIEAAGEDYRAAVIQVATDAGLRRSEIAGLQWGDIDWLNNAIYVKRHVVASGKGEARLTRILPGTKESKGKPEGPLYLSDRSMAMLRDTKDRLAFLGKSWQAGTATSALYVKTSRARVGTAYVIPANPVADDAWVWPNVTAQQAQKPGAVRNTDTSKATRACRRSTDGAVYEPTSLGNWFAALVDAAQLPTQDGADKTLHDLRHDCATFLIARRVPLPVVARMMRHKDASVTSKTYVHLLKEQELDGRDTFNRIWAETWAEGPQAQAV